MSIRLGQRNEAFFTSASVKKESGTTAVHHKLAQAQRTGILDLSNLELVEFPCEILDYYKKQFGTLELHKIEVLSSLNISHNDIKHIPDLTEIGQLKSINLSRNKIRKLPKFQSGKLIELDISNNALISLDLSLITSNCHFSINASSNVITELLLPDSEITINKLNLANNKLESFNSKSVDIMNLNLSGNSLHAIDLSSCREMSELYISNNKLSNIVGIQQLSNLIILMADSNSLTEMPKASKDIKTLNVAHNKIKSVNLSTIYPKLSVLLLDHNEIETLQDSINIYIPSIATLSLNCCYLKYIPPTLALFLHLTKLKINENAIRNIPSHMINTNTRDLIDYMKTKLTDEQLGIVKEERLDLYYKNGNLQMDNLKLIRIPDVVIDSIDIIREDIRTISIKNNKISDICPLGPLFSAKMLKSVDISFNPINSIPQELYAQMYVTEFIARGCRLSTFVINMPNLQKLNLSENRIENIPIGIHNSLNIIDIDLHDNNIAELEYSSIEPLKQLRRLNMSNNMLKSIPLDICRTNIRDFAIYGNRIRSIPQHLMNGATNDLFELLSLRLG